MKENKKVSRKRASELQETYYLQSMQEFASGVKREARMVSASTEDLVRTMRAKDHLRGGRRR